MSKRSREAKKLDYSDEDLTNDPTETYEETCQRHLNSQINSRKRAHKITQDEIDYETFKQVDLTLNYFSMCSPDQEFTEFLLPQRNSSLVDLFHSQLSHDLLDDLIAATVDLYPQGLLPIFYKNANTRDCPDILGAKRSLLIHYFAIRFWTDQSNQNSICEIFQYE